MEKQQQDFFWECSENDKFCDLYFQCYSEDDSVETFGCHAVILMFKMKGYLDNLVEFNSTANSKVGETKSNPILLKEIPGGSKTFKQVLKYVYGRPDFQISNENVLSLLITAERFLMLQSSEYNDTDNLKECCCRFLEANFIASRRDIFLPLIRLVKHASKLSQSYVIPDSMMEKLIRKLSTCISSDTLQGLSCSDQEIIVSSEFHSLECEVKHSIISRAFQEQHISTVRKFISILIHNCSLQDQQQLSSCSQLIGECKSFGEGEGDWEIDTLFMIQKKVLVVVSTKDGLKSRSSLLVAHGDQNKRTNKQITKDTEEAAAAFIEKALFFFAGLPILFSDCTLFQFLFFLSPSDFLSYLRTATNAPPKPELGKVVILYLKSLLDDDIVWKETKSARSFLPLVAEHVAELELLMHFSSAHDTISANELLDMAFRFHSLIKTNAKYLPLCRFIDYSQLSSKNIEKVMFCDMIPTHIKGDLSQHRIRLLELELLEQKQKVATFLKCFEGNQRATNGQIFLVLNALMSLKPCRGKQVLEDFAYFLVGKNIEVSYSGSMQTRCPNGGSSSSHCYNWVKNANGIVQNYDNTAKTHHIVLELPDWVEEYRKAYDARIEEEFLAPNWNLISNQKIKLGLCFRKPSLGSISIGGVKEWSISATNLFAFILNY